MLSLPFQILAVLPCFCAWSCCPDFVRCNLVLKPALLYFVSCFLLCPAVFRLSHYCLHRRAVKRSRRLYQIFHCQKKSFL
ncbi:hypothetical protein DFH11DRAFT_1571743 [Phellopilus nigrolimitatus]|nr:hypothetical protein DFH11DRAFT_1571743 [Phellopilus nigrolimitatus]